MHGFKGFADVVSRIKSKLVKKISINQDDSCAVNVEYNGVPIIEQIEKRLFLQ